MFGEMPTERKIKMTDTINEISKSDRRPWLGSGIEVDVGSDNIREVMKIAKLDWEVEGRPLFIPVGSADNTTSFEIYPSHKAIVRKTDEQQLGIVGKDWNILQNEEVFSFVDDLSNLGLVKYHSAGQFKNGKLIWVQAEFQESEILPEDVHKKYLIFSNAFDGTFSIRIGWTDVRVVCMNTFMMASKEARQNGFAIRHTTSMRDKIQLAKNALVLYEKEAKQLDMFQKALTRLSMTTDMWKDFSYNIIPDPEGKNKTRSNNNRNKLIELSIMGTGQDIPGVHGTGYAALNALTEFVNYERSSRGNDDLQRQANRYQATLFGTGQNLINKGIDSLNHYLVDNGIQVETVN